MRDAIKKDKRFKPRLPQVAAFPARPPVEDKSVALASDLLDDRRVESDSERDGFGFFDRDRRKRRGHDRGDRGRRGIFGGIFR
ncbi:hypothetical protein [Methyloligella halotolerans]|nr:hypothetical protein [Methyloligella halotolerans]